MTATKQDRGITAGHPDGHWHEVLPRHWAVRHGLCSIGRSKTPADSPRSAARVACSISLPWLGLAVAEGSRACTVAPSIGKAAAAAVARCGRWRSLASGGAGPRKSPFLRVSSATSSAAVLRDCMATWGGLWGAGPIVESKGVRPMRDTPDAGGGPSGRSGCLTACGRAVPVL